MTKNNLILFLVVICLGSLSAQTFIRKINAHPDNYSQKLSGTTDTLKILAVMVEFQTDQDAATEGNGGSARVNRHSIIRPGPKDRHSPV